MYKSAYGSGAVPSGYDVDHVIDLQLGGANDMMFSQFMNYFYEKSHYPLFVLSVYNLVPACGNCNRIKSRQNIELASPFDETN